MLGRKLETFRSILWNHRPTWGIYGGVVTQTVPKWKNLFLKVKASCLLKIKIYLFLWHLTKGWFSLLQLSSHHLLPISTTCTRTKADMPPNLKKTQTWSIYTFTLPQSICPASTVVTHCCSAFLTSWDCIPNCHFRHGTWCHFNCRWVVREKT